MLYKILGDTLGKTMILMKAGAYLAKDENNQMQWLINDADMYRLPLRARLGMSFVKDSLLIKPTNDFKSAAEAVKWLDEGGSFEHLGLKVAKADDSGIIELIGTPYFCVVQDNESNLISFTNFSEYESFTKVETLIDMINAGKKPLCWVWDEGENPKTDVRRVLEHIQKLGVQYKTRHTRYMYAELVKPEDLTK